MTFSAPRRFAYRIAVVCPLCPPSAKEAVAIVAMEGDESPRYFVDGTEVGDWVSHHRQRAGHALYLPGRDRRNAVQSARRRPWDDSALYGGRVARVVAKAEEAPQNE